MFSSYRDQLIKSHLQINYEVENKKKIDSFERNCKTGKKRNQREVSIYKTKDE
jgi:hypothetical protein